MVGRDTDVPRWCPLHVHGMFDARGAPGSIVPDDPTLPGDQGGEADCSCVNAWTNRAPGAPDLNPGIPGLQNDGRLWNRFMRGHPGRYGNAANRCPALRNERGVEVETANFRLRYRTVTQNGNAVPAGRVCQELDVTHQLGCLSRAAECTLGFAAREAIINQPDDSATPSVDESYDAATALLVGGTGPDESAIYSDSYVLERRMYLNSIVGFEAILAQGQVVAHPHMGTGTGLRRPSCSPAGCGAELPEQAQLIECLLTEDAAVDAALAASGLLRIDLADPTPFKDPTGPGLPMSEARRAPSRAALRSISSLRYQLAPARAFAGGAAEAR